MRISSFSLIAVLSCVSVVLAFPIEGRTPATGIDRRQPDGGSPVEDPGNLLGGAAGTLQAGSDAVGSPAKGSLVNRHDRRQGDGAVSVNDLLDEILNAVNVILGPSLLGSLPVTENDCRNLGDVNGFLNRISGVINGILSNRGRPGVIIVPLTGNTRAVVLTPIQIRINAILGACRLSLVAIVLDV